MGIVGDIVGSVAGGVMGGGSGGGGGGGSSSTMKMSSHPMGGQLPPKTAPMQASKSEPAKVVSAGSTTVRPFSDKGGAVPDFQDVWANRLSHMLDYNTRKMGK